HDMRSPLRAIVSFTELVLQDSESKLAPEARKFLEQVAAAARRLDRLIQDVLAFSRVSNMQLEIQSVNVERLLHETIAESPHLQYPASEIKIESPLPAVKGDEASLTQCFANLLNNAVKFVPEGVKPRVRIFSRGNGDSVCIWVEDNGIGIDAD